MGISWYEIKRNIPFIDKWYDLKYGVKSLIKWFPVIWHDRDWDFVYLLEVMRFKMDEMAKLHDDGWAARSPEYAAELRRCVELCEKIIKDGDEFQFGDGDKGNLDELTEIMRENLVDWWD